MKCLAQQSACTLAESGKPVICADAAGHAESQIALQQGPDKCCQALRQKAEDCQKKIRWPRCLLPFPHPWSGLRHRPGETPAKKPRHSPICAQSCSASVRSLLQRRTPHPPAAIRSSSSPLVVSLVRKDKKRSKEQKITAHPCCHAVSPARQLPWNRGRAFLRHRAGHSQNPKCLPGFVRGKAATVLPRGCRIELFRPEPVPPG